MRVCTLTFMLFTCLVTLGQRLDSTKYTWDIREVYANEEKWSEDLNKLTEKDYFSDVQFISSSQDLKKICQSLTEMMKDIRKLNVYVALRELVETDFQPIEFNRRLGPVTGKKYQDLEIKFNESGLTNELLDMYLEQDPGLKPYRYLILSFIGETDNVPKDSVSRSLLEIHNDTKTYTDDYNIFRQIHTFPEIVLSNGDTLTIQEFTDYRQYQNRSDREKIYRAIKTELIKFSGLYSNMLIRKMGDMKLAAASEGKQPIEYMMESSSVPTSYYETFIEAINENISLHHRYIKLMAKMLELDTLNSWDLYVVPEFDDQKEYPIEDGIDIIKKALLPYGERYANLVKDASENRWIDIRTLPNKRPTVRNLDDPHPFVSVLYDNSYNTVRSLGHELGHCIEYVLSSEKYAYPTMFLPDLFVEVPSNVNECLINHYMLSQTNETDPFLLVQTLFYLNGSLFTTAMNAEVEYCLYKTMEETNYLDRITIKETFLETARKYYGESEGIAKIDNLYFANISGRWYLHEFYRLKWFNYSIGTVIASNIKDGLITGRLSPEDYINFITAGSVNLVDKLLKDLGIDMESKEAYEPIFDEIEHLLDLLERQTAHNKH
ncbi:MAG: M3 family metallopeptidase [Bacteroidota bacterium]